MRHFCVHNVRALACSDGVLTGGGDTEFSAAETEKLCRTLISEGIMSRFVWRFLFLSVPGEDTKPVQKRKKHRFAENVLRKAVKTCIAESVKVKWQNKTERLISTAFSVKILAFEIATDWCRKISRKIRCIKMFEAFDFLGVSETSEQSGFTDSGVLLTVKNVEL